MTIFFPLAVVVLSALASLYNYMAGHWKDGTFWLALAVANLMVILK